VEEIVLHQLGGCGKLRLSGWGGTQVEITWKWRMAISLIQ